MKSIMEIANDCVGQTLLMMGYKPAEGDPPIKLNSEELSAIAPIIAAMITATIDREKIALQERIFVAKYGKGYNGG